MRVGFIWISLDSLARNETYQWVMRKNRAKVFLGLLPLALEAPERAPHDFGLRKSGIVQDKLNLVSDLRQ
jgi:hypothetical protein